ncbi:hypothetical protein [Nonomuraea roseoviolacea]|uniref:ABC transporter permease n=1 Tax=Nonomuraea roseoviolacea subsp. carminata TaxID=160689 RepID=A0ABT1KEN0_9ACTN|nr:hypothetical protein [Nonomuraea roseoviolacea]MCP2351379.1 hypothetical protein [Nonomuraea roseoviolacea subsp. carminata]
MRVIRLIGPVARAVDWIPVLVSGLLVVVLVSVLDAGSPLGSGTALTLLRMAGPLLGAAAGFTVLDEMAASTAASPVPRVLRHRIRCAAGALTAGACWAAACAIAVARLPAGGVLPVPGIAVEAAACVVAGLLAATVAARRYEGRAAALAGMGGLLAVFAVTLVLRGPYWPWLYPREPAWETVHHGWTAALAVLLVALDVAGRGPWKTR